MADEKEVVLEFKNPAFIILLVILGVLLVMEMQVAFGNPVSFGDEGYYGSMAKTFGQDLDYPKWTPFRSSVLAERGYSKPPLWPMLQGGIMMFVGSGEAVAKFLTPFIGFLIGVAYFLLIKRLTNEKLALIAAIMISTIPSFVTYTVTFYVEMLEVLYTTMFLFLFILGIKEDKMKYLFVSTFFAVLAYFTKKTGLLLLGLVVVGFVYELIKKKQLVPLLKRYAVLLLVPMLLSSALIFRTYIMYGGFCDVPIFEVPPLNSMVNMNCDVFLFESKYDYVGTTAQVGTEQNIWTLGVADYVNSAYGNIWFIALAAAAGLFVFAARRDVKDVLVIAFLVLYIPVLIRSGRSEDAARFALPWVAAFGLLAASYYDEIYNFAKSRLKGSLPVAVLAILVIITIAVGCWNFYGQLSSMSSIKQFYPSFFEGCEWVKENTPENSLVSTLYVYKAGYCSDRRVATQNGDMALSNNATYAYEVAKAYGINYVWINKFAIDPSNNHYSEMTDVDYVKMLEENNSTFAKVYEDGNSLQSCQDMWLQGSSCDGNIVYRVA